MIGNLIIAYIVGFVAITVAVRLMLRSEPTAHGQIVGRQVGCIIAALWPVALPWIGLVGAGVLIRRTWKRLGGETS